MNKIYGPFAANLLFFSTVFFTSANAVTVLPPSSVSGDANFLVMDVFNNGTEVSSAANSTGGFSIDQPFFGLGSKPFYGIRVLADGSQLSLNATSAAIEHQMNGRTEVTSTYDISNNIGFIYNVPTLIVGVSDAGRNPAITGDLYADVLIVLKLNDVVEFKGGLVVVGSLGPSGQTHFNTNFITNAAGPPITGISELVQIIDSDGNPTFDTGMVFHGDPIEGTVDLLDPLFATGILTATYEVNVNVRGGGGESWASVKFADPFDGESATFLFDDTAAAVDEPSTVLMLLIGMIVLGGFHGFGLFATDPKPQLSDNTG